MPRWLKLTLYSIGAVLLVLCLTVVGFLTLAPTFGAAPSGASLERINASTNYKNGRFENLMPTRVDTSDPDKPVALSEFFFPKPGKNPQAPLPSQRFGSQSLKTGHFVWLGHSTVMFNTGTLRVLADPVFHRASPIPLVGNAFPLRHTTRVSDMGSIDVILISHDHYDHLDHQAIAELDSATQRFLVPLGLAAHLERWGVAAQKIEEFDWYDGITIGDTRFTLTPSRHFSGRGLTNRFSTLWGSWVVASPVLKVFFSGDTGYFDGLKDIGTRYGPFDIAFLENGAYNDDWNEIHMYPEQAAQASLDLNAAVFFPIHWSKFDLSLHPWREPIERGLAAAQALGVVTATPLIGEVFSLDKVPQRRWWKNVDAGSARKSD